MQNDRLPQPASPRANDGLDAADSCRDCTLRSSRRQFFSQVSVAVVAAMVGLDAAASPAAALTVASTSGQPAGSEEHAFPLPAGDGVSIDRETQVILVRFQGRVYAFNLSCPHENTALRWRAGDTRFQCPRHESKYQPDGTFTSGRATRNMDRFAIKRSGTSVIVDLARLYRSDQNAAEWAAAVVPV